MRPAIQQRRAELTTWLGMGLLAGGCAPLKRAPAQAGHWSGRLSLSVRSEPAQSFSTAFDLRGDAIQGQLELSTPLGTTLAQARWVPGLALLQSGQDRRRFDSMEALLESVTGAALPLAALFDWLSGQASEVPGWEADLTRHAEGRLSARRNHPSPAIELRILLEP